jgi:hypothetical protein
MMILHLCVPEKFTRQFIEFTVEHFDTQSHKFLFQVTENELRERDPATYAAITSGTFPFEVFFYEGEKSRILRNLKLVFEMYRCEKIIIHGLFLFYRMAHFLANCPFLLRKSYWVMWGGDFYFLEDTDVLTRKIIRKMGHLLTFLPGDVQYVRKHYGATGKHIDCLGYPSNVFQHFTVPPKIGSTLRIQVGNSANPTNHHREVLKVLAEFKDRDIEIVCPLSYGEPDYRERVISVGKRLFADKFVPLVEFLPFEEYRELLASIDIAIFNHNRQQGMGNIISHLGLGHKVYLRSDQSPWKFLTGIGLELNDISEGISIEYNQSIKNQRVTASYFRREKLMEQWRKIYERPSWR